MLRRNLQRISQVFWAHWSWKKPKCYPWHFTISGYIITSEIVVATPHLQRLSGLLCAVLQHFASTAQHWASEDGLRMINQLISFKSVALIIVMSPVPHSSLELQHTVSTVKVLEPIGPGKNHAGTRAFHLRQINHQLWKQQWLNLTFRGYQAPCLSSLWMVLERFVCNRSTFSLGDVHLIFMWAYWYWSRHL